MEYDSNYYSGNEQDRDRPALWLYERLWKRLIGSGPVLEFGGGVGFFAKRLCRHADVYVVEVNDFARNKIRLNAPKARLIRHVTDLPDDSLGSIVSLHVLEHILDKDLREIGREFGRVLEPGGKLLLVMPCLNGRAHELKQDRWSAFSDPTHVNLKTREGWERFFSEVWGFDVLHVFADGYYDFPYGKTLSGRFIGDLIRLLRTGVQFLVARPMLTGGDGENVVFVLGSRK